MVSCNKLLEELEEFKRHTANELELRPLEKWMIKRLGVRRLDETGGSAVRYEQEALKEFKGDGVFTIHIAKGGKQRPEIIYRKNFLVILYPRLKEIIDYMRKEGLCAGQEP